MNESANANGADSPFEGGVIVAARPEDVGPNELVPAEDVPAGLVIPKGYVARRLLPFSKPPSISTRLIR